MSNFIATITLLLVLSGCSATSLETKESTLGTTTSMAEMLAVAPINGPIIFEKHTTADWQVPLSGLINLDHPAAISQGLVDKSEPIQIFAYLLKHPEYGNYLVDSGVSESLRDIENNQDIAFIIKQVMDLNLKIKATTFEVTNGKVDGVFITHLHLDHILGLKDLNENIPVYVGPGEVQNQRLDHVATQGTTDRLLGIDRQLMEWTFGESEVLDVFGDKSLFAIHVPGHTPGSVAFLARTTNGPQLMIGDATHTRWGWENQVEPGTYSNDQPGSAVSLRMLLDLATEVPTMVVHPGHQSL